MHLLVKLNSVKNARWKQYKIKCVVSFQKPLATYTLFNAMLFNYISFFVFTTNISKSTTSPLTNLSSGTYRKSQRWISEHSHYVALPRNENYCLNRGVPPAIPFQGSLYRDWELTIPLWFYCLVIVVVFVENSHLQKLINKWQTSSLLTLFWFHRASFTNY